MRSWDDLNKIGSLLDDTVSKGMALERKGKVERVEEELTKSLSFDPYQPHQMGENSPYYNPYQQFADGSFGPYPEEYWESRGKSGTEYLTTRKWMEQAGINREKEIEREQQRLAQEISNRFRSLAKSMDSLIKAEPATSSQGRGVPVGTVHTYSDGQRYKKVAEGKWSPVAGLEKNNVRDMLNHPKHGPSAHAALERHASSSTKLNEHLKKKQDAKAIIEQAKHETRKEVMTHVKTALEKIYASAGQPVPKDVAEHLSQAAHGPASDGPHKLESKPLDGIEAVGKPKKATGAEPHEVEIDFEYNGQSYSRKFSVPAKGPHEAQAKVSDALMERLGRATQIHRLSAKRIKGDRK